jgi:hypothetical protein
MPQESKVLFLIPAPDMDERAIATVTVEGFQVIPLKLAPIDESTCLDTYLASLVAQVPSPGSTLLGFCYGAILAIEISGMVQAQKVVVVSGIKSSAEIAFSRKLAARIFLLLPNVVLSGLGRLVAFLVNEILRSEVRIPRIWLKSAQNKFIVRHALHFSGPSAQTPKILHIHGEKDAALPAKSIRDARIIPGAGHFLFVTNRKDMIRMMADT